MSVYNKINKLITLKPNMSDEQKNDLLNKMDMFLLLNKLSIKEYEELYVMLGFEIQENTVEETVNE